MAYADEKAELLRKHAEELEAFEDRWRRENQVLSIQASHLSHKDGSPYVLEIVFPLDPHSREKDRVNCAIDKALKASLEEIGYKLTWKEPKTWE